MELAQFVLLCAFWSERRAKRTRQPRGSEEEHVTGISELPPAKLAAHEAAVARLRDAYAAVPPDIPVRLAKPTSNLFRFRAPAGRDGADSERVRQLDVSAFGRVIHVDPA